MNDPDRLVAILTAALHQLAAAEGIKPPVQSFPQEEDEEKALELPFLSRYYVRSIQRRETVHTCTTRAHVWLPFPCSLTRPGAYTDIVAGARDVIKQAANKHNATAHVIVERVRGRMGLHVRFDWPVNDEP